MEIFSKIEFATKSFKFIVRFDEGILHLECSHANESLTWRASVTEPIGSNNNNSLKWDLKPKMLYKLFEEHTKDTINPISQFVFPEKYETPESDLIIKLVTKLPYSDDSETKSITLKAYKITEFELFSLKYDEKFAQMQKKINELEKKINDNTVQPTKIKINRIVSGGYDGIVKIWNATTGALIHSLDNRSFAVHRVAMSPDNNLVASGSSCGSIKIYNAETGAFLQQLTGHNNRVMGVVFSPDGKTIASGSTDKTIKIWNYIYHNQLFTVNLSRTINNSHDIMNLIFSPDGENIVSCDSNHSIKIWDAKTGELIKMHVAHTTKVRGIVFSPDGDIIVSGSDDNTVKIWNAKTGELIRTLDHDKGINSVAFSPNGEMIASGGDDNIVKIFNAKNGTLIRSFEGHTYLIWSVAFSPDSKMISSACSGHIIKVWNIETGATIQTLTGHIDSVIDIKMF